MSSASVSSVTYRNAQWFKALWLIMLLVAPASFLIVWTSGDAQRNIGLVVLAVVDVSVLVLLGRFVVSIDRDYLRWQYGWLGFPRWHAALTEIVAVEKCKVTGVGGSGVKFSREGWVYSAGGADGVRITLRNGKTFRIGSNDHDRLFSMLANRVGQRL